MSVLDSLETAGPEAMTEFEHAAAWLVGTAALNATVLSTLTERSRLVLDAMSIGEEAAESYGVPVVAMINGSLEVLTLAKQFAEDLTRLKYKPVPPRQRVAA